jgi:hypothetical protein
MGNCTSITLVDAGDFAALEAEQKLGISSQSPKFWIAPLSGDTEVSTTDTAEGFPPMAIRTITPSDALLSLSHPHDENEVGKCLHNQEFGTIQCEYSSLDDAKSESERTGKPILYFEIDEILKESEEIHIFSHPLVIEAAESLFVTVRMYPGAPAKSVRVLDQNGNDVVAGIDGNHVSVGNIVSLMTCALKALQIVVPTYLLLLDQEEKGKARQSSDGTVQQICRLAVFGMSESHVGEVELGGQEGVLSTRTGYLGRQRVVQVSYDSTQVSYGSLLRFALNCLMVDAIYYSSNDERIAARVEVQRKQGKCQILQLSGNILADFDSKHFLRQTVLRYVPLTDLQGMLANRLVAMGALNEATRLLSPRQGVIMMKSMYSLRQRVFDEVVDVPIELAWRCAS